MKQAASRRGHKLAAVTVTQAPPLATFTDLRRLAAMSPVAHACIELRTMEIAGTGWDIVPEPAVAQAIKGQSFLVADFAERRAKAVTFFRRPDPNYADFTSWLRAAVREVLTVAALVIFPHPAKRPGAGLLGGDVASLDILDGSLIEPVLGPGTRPGHIGYAQYGTEVPRRTLAAMLAQPLSGVPEALYGRDQLMYLACGHRPGTPFGYSPLEEALEDRDDGTEPGSNSRLLEAFGLPAQALGIIDGYLVDDATRDAWLCRYRDGFASIFNSLLADSGLRWKWEGLP